MSAEKNLRVVDLLHPEILGKETLLSLFHERKVPCSPSQSLDELIHLFYGTLLPLPQRKVRRLKDFNGPSKDRKAISLSKRKAISLSKRKAISAPVPSLRIEDKIETITSFKESNSPRDIRLYHPSTKDSSSVNNDAHDSKTTFSHSHRVTMNNNNESNTNSNKISLSSNSDKRMLNSEHEAEDGSSNNKFKHPRITWP